jgi:hypothetical protein
MNVSEASEITGGLSHPSKMPGPAYSLPAKDCKLGSELAKLPGTTCHNCYALKGRYLFPRVQTALSRRLESLTDERWVEAMVVQIRSSKTKYFRWHDSGDIQSADHLGKIAAVCSQLPNVKFWLPTREYAIVHKFMESSTIPSNLAIRLSAHKIDAEPPFGYGLPTSTVHTHGAKVHGKECRAYTRSNQCGTCRACWDVSVVNVSYPKH